MRTHPSVVAIALTALIVLVACKSAVAATSARFPTGIDAISDYAGTWHGETTALDTPYSKAHHETSTIRNDCWRSGEFYACHQYVNGESGALIVYFYLAKEDRYVTHANMPGTGVAQDGTLVIHGNVWTYPWTQTDKGKVTYFRVVNTFTSADTIEYRSEYSTDHAHWVRMSTGSEWKVAAAPAG